MIRLSVKMLLVVQLILIYFDNRVGGASDDAVVSRRAVRKRSHYLRNMIKLKCFFFRCKNLVLFVIK